jgi:ribose transport system permease protein
MFKTTSEKKLNRSASYYFNQYKIFVILIALFIIAVAFAPNFFNPFNLNALLKTANLYGMMSIGLSIVMIGGNLDLSIQSMMNLGSVMTLGMFTNEGLSWPIAIAIGIGCGLGVGLANGLLVSKAGINSFIVTLGMMTIIQGIIFLYCKSGSISVKGDYAFSDKLVSEVIPLLTPITIITLIAVAVFALIMIKTTFGRSVYIIGGNPDTAWLAGIKRDNLVIITFVISGGLSALAGSLFAIGQGTAVPNIGDKGISPLVVTIAAAIIGGVSMSGGRGGIVRSYFAVLTMMLIFNMLSCFGAGYEIQMFAAGCMLAFSVLYESVLHYMQDKVKGIRLPLLLQAEAGRSKG